MGDFSIIRHVDAGTFTSMMQNILDSALNLPIYQTMLDVCLPIGICLTLIYCLLELADKVSMSNFSTDTIIFQFIKFVIVFTVITNTQSILVGMNEFNSSINTDIQSYFTSYSILDEYIDYCNVLSSSGAAIADTTSAYMASITVKSATLFNVVAQVLIVWVSVIRAMKICIKSAFAPLVIPDMYNNGLSSSGFKYLKSIFGLYMQSTIVLLIVEMTMLLSSSGGYSVVAALTNFQIVNMIGPFICLCILVGSIKKTESFAEEIFM